MSGYQIDTVSHVVTREAFTKVGEAHGKIPHIITRAWNATRTTAEYYTDPSMGPGTIWAYRLTHDDPNVIDFGDVITAVRFLEAGRARFLTLGETAWNIVADIHNEGLQPNNPNYLLEWVNVIHQGLRGGVASRERAAQRIADVYSQLGALTVAQVNYTRL